jgi:hypothetical protein
MKRQFLSAVLVTTALLTGSFAYCDVAKPLTRPSTREISLTTPLQKIEVGNNIQIVLVPDVKKSTITVTGDESLVSGVKFELNEAQLSISSKKSLKNKNIRIYIPVSTLKTLVLQNGSTVSSEGLLQMEALKVVVHAGSKVALQTLGKLAIESADDCDFVYEKYEKSQVVYIEK